MSLFIPPNQLQNMIDCEVGQIMSGRGNVGKLIALSTLQHTHNRHQPMGPIVINHWTDDDEDFDY